jgi:hypothetical protein
LNRWSSRLTGAKSLASSDDLGETFELAGPRQLALPINIYFHIIG